MRGKISDMMKYFNPNRWWNKLEDWACFVSFVIMSVLLFVQVVTRFVLKWSVPILEEYSLYVFIYFVFFTSSNMFLRNEHIRVEFVVNLFPKKLQLVLVLLSAVLNVFFSVVCTYVGWECTYRRISLGAVSTTMFPLWIMFFTVPLCFGLATIRSLQNIYFLIKYEVLGKPLPDYVEKTEEYL